jgi:hypothetical protein
VRPHPRHDNNGEEALYRNGQNRLNYIANYSKGLPHDDDGEVDPRAYRTLLRALSSGDPHDFEQIRLAPITPPNQFGYPTGVWSAAAAVDQSAGWPGVRPRRTGLAFAADTATDQRPANLGGYGRDVLDGAAAGRRLA